MIQIIGGTRQWRENGGDGELGLWCDPAEFPFLWLKSETKWRITEDTRAEVKKEKERNGAKKVGEQENEVKIRKDLDSAQEQMVEGRDEGKMQMECSDGWTGAKMAGEGRGKEGRSKSWGKGLSQKKR